MTIISLYEGPHAGHIYCTTCGDFYPLEVCSQNVVGQVLCPMRHRGRTCPVRRRWRPRVDA